MGQYILSKGHRAVHASFAWGKNALPHHAAGIPSLACLFSLTETVRKAHYSSRVSPPHRARLRAGTARTATSVPISRETAANSVDLLG